MGDPDLGKLTGALDRDDAGCARTQWEALSIGDVLGKLATMGDGRAAGDAAALESIPGLVSDAVAALRLAFGSDDMLGLAATSNVTRGRMLAAEIDASRANGQKIVEAVSRADRAIAQTRALEPQLRALQQDVQEYPEHSAAARAQVQSAMDDSYSSPMIDAHSVLPSFTRAVNLLESPLSGPSRTSTANDSLDNNSTNRGQAANTTDAGDLDPSGAGGGPSPGGTRTTNQNVTNSNPDSTSGTPTETPTTTRNSPGDDDLTGLRRGARGTPIFQTTTQPNLARPGSKPNAIRGRGATPDGLTPDGLNGVGVAPGLGSTLGPGNSGTSPAAGNPASGTSANSAQRAGAPGMPPSSAGRRRSDDRTHTPALYLHSEDNGRELVGGMPLVGPPVLGDWVPHATPAPTPQPMANDVVATDEAVLDTETWVPLQLPGQEPNAVDARDT